MFYYYGRKKQLASWYPEPEGDTIIEPFAGSAAYSLHGERWKKNVTLVELNPRVCEIWKWLIEDATESSVMAMPDLQVGEKTTELIHFLHTVSNAAFNMRTLTVSKFLADNWNRNKRYIAKNVHKVKHWKLICGDYSEAPDVDATWFIDPPYSGEHYAWGYECGESIDYGGLGSWVRVRKGQIIACERDGADWLPFESLARQSSRKGKTFTEVVYLRPTLSNA